MRRKLAMTAALVVALAVAGYAQKPDFSGTWTPDPAPDAAAVSVELAPDEVAALNGRDGTG